MRPLALLPLLLLFAVIPCRGQDPAEWIADLGDARGEEAEIGLVALGERAAPLLIEVLRETGRTAGVRRARQAAALRVLALLGPDAAAVGADLADVAIDEDLLSQWVQTSAALEPWAHSDWSAVFTHSHDLLRDGKGEVILGFVRHLGRKVPVDLDTADLRERLTQNRIFEREAVADLLGRKRDRAALEPLCRMLCARDVAPAGHDAIRHNGFVVPVEDRFRFAASEAVLRIAPDDPHAATGWSGRARLHPHRSVRLAALAALARFAPDIDDTVPDLLAIARGNDAALAVEAIKVLGMARSGGAAVVGELEQLAAGSGDAAQRSKALVARLHAAGVVAAPQPGAAATGFAFAIPDRAPAEDPLRKAVASLRTLTDQVRWNTVVAGGAPALPLLLERLRKEHTHVPDAVVLAIARIGSGRPPAERDDLRAKLQGRYGDNWESLSFSCSMTGGDDGPGEADFFALAELRAGGASEPGELAELLASDHPYVRLIAAQRLAACEAPPADVRAALVAAARAAHPKQCPREDSAGARGPHEVDLDARIHAAAAVALVASELSADERAEFLPLLRAGTDVAAIARGLRRWASPRSLPALTDALTDDRAAIVIAAAEAIGSLGKDGAPAAPALREAAARSERDVARAAEAALRA